MDVKCPSERSAGYHSLGGYSSSQNVKTEGESLWMADVIEITMSWENH